MVLWDTLILPLPLAISWAKYPKDICICRAEKLWATQKRRPDAPQTGPFNDQQRTGHKFK